VKQALFLPLLAAGFVVAFLHAAIPTHWLPFVVTGRAQGWTRPRTLMVAAFVCSGHVVFTAFLGLLAVAFGIAADRLAGGWLPWIAGGALMAFGGYYLVRQFRGLGSHRHTHGPAPRTRIRDRAAILGLFALLALSPCEAFLPIYVSAARTGWLGFAALSAVLAVATLAGMVLFSALAWAGMERLRLDRLERYESGILGAVLCALGVAVILIEG